MYKYYILIVLSLILLLLFKIHYIRLANLLNLYDIPDFKRKIHHKKVPLVGGPLVYIFFLFVVFFDILYLDKINTNLLFEKNGEFLIFLSFSSIFFLIGIYDDKFNLKADKKLFLYFFVICFFLTVNNNLLIKDLKFSFLNEIFFLNKFSFVFTALAILLFLNSLNMFDGINLQSALYVLFFFFILFFKFNYNFIFLLLIIFLFFFLLLNNKNKLFMGESGINFLGFILSYFTILAYNKKIINFADEIFLIMCIPGFDLLRLSISRLYHGKHPFSADKNHIHHNLLKKFDPRTVAFVIFFIITFPYILFLIFNSVLLSILLSFIIYCITLSNLVLKKK